MRAYANTLSQSQPAKADVVLANPAPLGLMGFGVTTVLLNFANANQYTSLAPVLAMGIFYVVIAQIIAGIMEFRKGNTFGTVAFLSYGLFWESFAAIFLIPGMGGFMDTTANSALAYYLFFWGVFTFLMWLGTFRLNGALNVVFLTLWILFFLLAIGKWEGFSATSSLAIGTGYEGVLCGLLAMYTSIAQVLNEVYGKAVLPLWPYKPKM